VLAATLIDAYEAEHFPVDPPDPIEAIKFRPNGGQEFIDPVSQG
jgi:antitoxin component HigA of HigAB toxin-antitoxin module